MCDCRDLCGAVAGLRRRVTRRSSVDRGGPLQPTATTHAAGFQSRFLVVAEPVGTLQLSIERTGVVPSKSSEADHVIFQRGADGAGNRS